MKDLMKQLQGLQVHTLIIRTSKVDTKEAFSIEANQAINYQNVTYKQHGEDAEKMIHEILRRAEGFKELTKGGVR